MKYVYSVSCYVCCVIKLRAMEYLKYLIFVIVFVCKMVGETKCDCILSLNKDFGSPQPVFLLNDSFLAPNRVDGTISLRRSESLRVACAGNKRFIVLANETTRFDFVDAQCVTNSTFRVGNYWQGEVKNITCNMQPWFTAETTKEKCYGGHTIIRVGYKIQDVFYKLYEACFDRNLLTTIYVKHHLSPGSNFIQNGGTRPQFLGGEMFGKTRISELYKTKNQRERLNAILGADMDKKYLTKNQFLTRGHLAPRADFPLRAEQRASFHYVNAAPQWMRGNAGDWAALEEALRRRIQSYGASVTLYTGTAGVSSLADSRGHQQELFLDVDANNNGIVPVPLYYYKLVYDPQRKTAAVFISINSSYYNTTTIKDLAFCSDICDRNPKYSWLKWRSSDGTHSFCCDYEEFSQKINALPKLKVRGLFY